MSVHFNLTEEVELFTIFNKCYRFGSILFEYFKTIDEKTTYSLGFRLKIEMEILYDEAIHNN
ncbi:hypothetical protein A9986_00275 [Solibacillus silvestris]|nr:hypothetical protein A9986_00275 [Solibacillus silvestris]